MRVVGWGVHSDDRVCEFCFGASGKPASLYVVSKDETGYYGEEKAACSSCVPLNTPDPVRDIFVKVLEKEQK